MPHPSPPRRDVLLAGATGLVGTQILAALLADESVAQVHALVRRPLELRHPRLQVHLVDFAQLPPLPPVAEVYLGLATTIKVAGSQQAFRAVDLDANLAVARAAHAAGARRIGVVSAIGADAASSNFYLKVKGELEDALAQLDLAALVAARPSLLLGDRDALQQPARPAEKLSAPIMKLIGPLLPRRYRAIDARTVARALVAALPRASGKVVLDYADLVRLAEGAGPDAASR